MRKQLDPVKMTWLADTVLNKKIEDTQEKYQGQRHYRRQENQYDCSRER
jgi:hypothetical protein